MSYRIRVYPQYGAAGLGGYGGYGSYGRSRSRARGYRQQVAHERQTAALRIAYERRMHQQQLKLVQLSMMGQLGGFGRGIGVPYGIAPAMMGPRMIGAVPPGFGQGNYTNQVACGPANQHVANANTYSSYTMNTGNPFGGLGFPFGAGAGILGGLF